MVVAMVVMMVVMVGVGTTCSRSVVSIFLALFSSWLSTTVRSSTLIDSSYLPYRSATSAYVSRPSRCFSSRAITFIAAGVGE